MSDLEKRVTDLESLVEALCGTQGLFVPIWKYGPFIPHDGDLPNPTPDLTTDVGKKAVLEAETNSQTLQLALDSSGVGRTIFIPPGSYLLRPGIKFGNLAANVNTTITGASPAYTYTHNISPATRLYFLSSFGSSDVGLDLRMADNDSKTSDGSGLKNLWISGQGVCTYCVAIGGMKVLSDCTFTAAGFAGVLATNAINSTVIERCGMAYNNGHGIIFIDEAGNNTKCSIRDCNFTSNKASGAVVYNLRCASFTGCTFENNERFGLEVVSGGEGRVAELTFMSCWFELNGDPFPWAQTYIGCQSPSPDEKELPDQIMFYNCHWNGMIRGNVGIKAVAVRRLEISGGVFEHPQGREVEAGAMAHPGTPLAPRFNYVVHSGGIGAQDNYGMLRSPDQYWNR